MSSRKKKEKNRLVRERRTIKRKLPFLGNFSRDEARDFEGVRKERKVRALGAPN